MIPVNTPNLSGNEKRYLAECIDTGWISSEGPFVKRLEEGVAARCGRKHGVAVANGTVALDVAVAALGIGPGDEVILPSLTIVSCALAIVRAGATPVVVDSDPLTWNMDVAQIEPLITKRTKAIMPVHIYGLPVDMDPLLALAGKHGLLVIEDAAEAIGQVYGRMKDEGGRMKGEGAERRTKNEEPRTPAASRRPCGSLGDISTLSFYPNKHITTGEGGMVLTDDDALAERCRDLRNLCFGKHRRFVHESPGWNFRMSNLQAAVGVAQLERLDESIARKRAIGRLYAEFLSSLPSCHLPLPSTPYAENIYWVFGLVLDPGHPLCSPSRFLNQEPRTKNEELFPSELAMQRLAEKGIGTRPFFWPMHEQPVFRKMGLFADARCPVAEGLARRGFYIPSGLGLTDAEVEQVAQGVRAALG
jgi:perosamine synthetase